MAKDSKQKQDFTSIIEQEVGAEGQERTRVSKPGAADFYQRTIHARRDLVAISLQSALYPVSGPHSEVA